ncbi:MAG: hypothetical protein JXR73_23015 [Candidatus Omnitrophica bacterium]|nr:hypothetical protein [Candidatus Omnitrophota bacterium]
MIALLGVICLAGRLTMLSAGHFQRAQTADQAGRMEEAVESYAWSIRNYYPGNPYCGRAIRGALHVIDECYKSEQVDRKQQALLELRAALLSIRSFYQPYRRELEQIDKQLQDSY